MKNNQYYVYAIKSLKNNRIYVGLSNNVSYRLTEHNLGKVKSTSVWRPWELIYQKFIGQRTKARIAEKKLKSGFIKEFLKKGQFKIVDRLLDSGVAQW